MADFGFNIKKTRSIQLTEASIAKFKQAVEAVPSYKNCIGCGGCTATCSARQYTNFNIRKVHFSLRRGIYDDAAAELQKCMLCGKCTLICPRGVNLRSLIINIRQIISNANEPFEDGKF